MRNSRNLKARWIGTSLLLAACFVSGCSDSGSILDDPGVSLPEEPPAQTLSDEAIALNNKAARLSATEPAEALRLLDKTIELEPHYDTAFASKAALLIRQKRYSEAIPCFERLAELRPHMPEYYFGWAWCLHLMGDEAEAKRRLRFAIAAYNEQLKLKPDDPWALTGRASVVYLHGDTELAQREIAYVLEAHPDFQVAKHLYREMQNPGTDPWQFLSK